MTGNRNPVDGKPQTTPSNREIASRLEEIAQLLDAQQANPFRVRAYYNAAETIRGLNRPIHQLLEEEGLEGLERLPTIGKSLARSIEQLIHTGTTPLLERLRGDIRPERVLTTVPGIGPILASRIHEELGIETLGDLLAAAYDGRLEQVPGFGPRRLRAVRESLAGRLHRRPRQEAPQISSPPGESEEPPVAELLDIDREYREKAQANRLPTIAPRRFNPTGEAWLPILHTQRGEHHYTALFSNTARAHELGMTRDWVVIYRDDRRGNGQWTVVTARFGPLRGKRIVRGREAECRAYYQAQTGQDTT
ncbi:MAG: DNA polymerase III [Litorilinea sp.]|nr:MAG: DNA polymerase III [Litorilinea sp.]